MRWHTWREKKLQSKPIPTTNPTTNPNPAPDKTSALHKSYHLNPHYPNILLVSFRNPKPPIIIHTINSPKSQVGRKWGPTRTNWNDHLHWRHRNINHRSPTKKTLKPLTSLKTIDVHKNVTNPYLFSGAPMVTTSVRSAGSRTKRLCCFIEEASRADIRLAKLKHLPLKKMMSFRPGRVRIYIHPSFCRALKLKYPEDIGGISWDGRVTTELGTRSLRQIVGILTPMTSGP